MFNEEEEIIVLFFWSKKKKGKQFPANKINGNQNDGTNNVFLV